MKVLFYVSLCLILIHYIIYPSIIFIYNKIKSNSKRVNEKEIDKQEKLPHVSLIVPVHNEEKIISKKIENILSLNYPIEKLEIIISNDNSTDKTLDILRELSNKNNRLRIIDIKERGGKVNAQNIAVKQSSGEIIVFSDANSMWEKDALIKLVSGFSDEKVVCVCGKLVYINENESNTSYSESLYWRIENKLKEYESNFYSLTAINGSIYGVKKEYYLYLNPFFSHDIALPLFYATKRKKTIFVKDAIAYEKSGISPVDEIKRKIRMFGSVYYFMFKNINLFINPFLYNFKFFFSVFSHRTIRYFLPFLHIILFVSSLFLYKTNLFTKTIFYLQIIFLFFANLGFIGQKFKYLRKFFVFYYYLIFISTMLIGFLKYILGKVKPYWEVIENIRNQ